MLATNIGIVLRQLREARGYTLKELAARSKLSIGFISQVERGQTDPSLASLKKLSTALNVKISELFAYEEPPHTLIRKGEGALMFIHGVKCELLCYSGEKTMEPMIKYIDPHSKSGCVEGHPGEEFVWIKSGSLRLSVGEDVFDLNEGDSIFFDASQDHGWNNPTKDCCEALWIISPPLYS